MFIPMYNWKSTSMIYIPQSHTNEYNTNTVHERSEICENWCSFWDWVIIFFLSIVWILILFMVIALAKWLRDEFF